MDDLVEAGLLVRRQGARTSVVRRLEKTLSKLTGFSDELRARGIEPGQRWLSRAVVTPSAAEAMALGLGPADRVVRLARVRLADGQPIAVERAAVPADFLPSADLVDHSLYAALSVRGAAPVRGMQRIRAGVMNRTDADLLNSTLGAPILIIERRCFVADGRVVEFTETRYNGESYEFLTELKA
jgi:GntR family transcriptional regulator